MNPLVSIIIPTYNRAHLIGETLDSIIVQSYTNWECIVVDDGSTDNTQELLKNYCNNDSRFQYYQRPTNTVKGPASCRNYGFELSNGEYITFFDDDDVMLDNSISRRVSCFKEHIDVVVCKLQHYNFDRNIILSESRIYSINVVEDYLVGKVVYFVSGPIWKRAFLLKQKDIFDVSIKTLDDWDFNLRMLYNNPKIALINEALINYRVHTNSLSQQVLNSNFEEVESEVHARMKHFWILFFKRKIKVRKYRKFIIEKLKTFLIQSLIKKDNSKYYLFRMLVICQIFDIDFIGVLKTSSGFISYSLFNKGYVFLK